jgi:predicted nucleic acid-binding Zn ribbon protein
MATYEYKCTNIECSEKEVLKEVNIPIKEYSDDKLPLCEKCKEKTSRNYTPNGHQTFGDNTYRA